MLEPIIILSVVLFVVNLTTYNDYTQVKDQEKMRDQYKREEKVSVLRNGEITSISCEDLVVGDICLLNYGDILPADGFCLVSNGLILDESALTGECDQLVKDRDNNFILLSRNIFLYSRI